MRRLLFFFSFICVVLANANAQRISFQDLLSFAGKKDWEDVNRGLTARGWKFEEVTEEKDDIKAIKYSYSNKYGVVIERILMGIRYESVVLISYSIADEIRYNSFLQSSRSLGFKKVRSTIKDGETNVEYSKKDMRLIVRTKVYDERTYNGRKKVTYTFILSNAFNKESASQTTVKDTVEITLYHMENLITDGNSDDINYFLVSNGWKFDKSTSETSEQYGSRTWVKLRHKEEEANEVLSVWVQGKSVVAVQLIFYYQYKFMRSIRENIFNFFLDTFGYKLVDAPVTNHGVFARYRHEDWCLVYSYVHEEKGCEYLLSRGLSKNPPEDYRGGRSDCPLYE